MSVERKRRANGEASRERILDAAAEIAGERGYEGASIKLVSERSGLPASSIYWQFKDKDELIAAVIERSFLRWRSHLEHPVVVAEDATDEDVLRLGLQRTGKALEEFPDFLRLGLMLILEHRPQEPTARERFLGAREATARSTGHLYRRVFPELDEADVERLVVVTLALADGLFVASEAGDVALSDAFDLMATAVLGTARALKGGAAAG